MIKAVFVVKCSSCKERYPSDVKSKDSSEMDFIKVDLDFETGEMSFVCPKCNNMNRIIFPSVEDINKHYKLPKMRFL